MQRDWRDIGFTAIATPHDHYVDFVIYEIECEFQDGSIGWHKAGAISSPTPVTSVAEAEAYLHGGVKWDGCSDWHFDEQERSMLHACSRSDLMHLGEAMARCWDWTKELLPNFDQ
jgi:hypothetical protein